MTQTSRPTAQHIYNYPNGDSGPYSSVQWRDIFKTMFTTDDNQGPVAAYLNELLATNPVGRTIQVASGAAVVGGNIFFSDATVSFSAPIPAGASRIDRVVVCLNDTDTVMTVSDAGYSLAFPSDLTDYNSAASIPAYSCRLAILRGSEGGGVPALDQNDDHYMIPLLQYTITTAGAVGNVTDEQVYVGASGGEKSFFVPATAGWNFTDSSHVYPTRYNSLQSHITGIECIVNKEMEAFGNFVVPDDYNTGLSFKCAVIPLNTGNLYGNSNFRAGACSEDCRTHAPSIVSASAVAAVAFQWTCVYSRALTDLVPGDIVALKFRRVADNVLDTISASVFASGFIVSYR